MYSWIRVVSTAHVFLENFEQLLFWNLSELLFQLINQLHLRCLTCNKVCDIKSVSRDSTFKM